MSTRWAAWIGVGLVAWFVAPVLLVRRELTATVALRQAPVAWSVGWRRAADGFRNGVWIDAGEQLRQGEALEIAPLPRADAPGGTTVQIVAVNALVPRRHAPVWSEALRRLAPGGGGSGWSTEGTGVVHRGPAGAPLRVAAPPGGVEVWLARRADGGAVALRYGGQEAVVDTAASEGGPVTLMRRRVDTRIPWMLIQPLPAVALSGLTLGWEGEPAGAIEVTDAAIVVRVAGVAIARRPLQLRLDGSDVAARDRGAPHVLRIDAAAARGEVRLEGPLDAGWLPRALAVTLTLAALAGVRAIVARRAAVVAWIARVPSCAVALAAIVAIRVWMAGWAPVLFYPDSTDYVNYAFEIVDPQRSLTLHPSQTAGYAVVLAPLVWAFDRFAPAIGVVQATFGILCALLVWDMLRRVVGPPWPVIGMLLVGFDPILLGYERVALSESTATLAATLVGWGIVRATGALLSNRPPRAARAGILLGLLCAVAVHVRGNFQTFVVLVPAALLAAGWRAGRLRASMAAATIVVACGALSIAPRVLQNWRAWGTPSFVVGRHYQRFVDGYAIGVVDENQTAAFGFEQWRALRRGLRSVPPTLSGLDMVGELMTASRLRPNGDLPPIVVRERVTGPVVDESMARRPQLAAQKALAALASQIGLWDEIHSQYRSAGNIFLLEPLRGTGRASTNLLFDEPSVARWSGATWFERARESTAALPRSLRAVWYNELFWAGRFVRPVVAVLFLVGLVTAIRERRIGLAAAGTLALTNAVALGVLVLSDYDRYSVPFTAVAGAVATFGLARLVGDPP